RITESTIGGSQGRVQRSHHKIGDERGKKALVVCRGNRGVALSCKRIAFAAPFAQVLDSNPCNVNSFDAGANVGPYFPGSVFQGQVVCRTKSMAEKNQYTIIRNDL